MWASAHIEPSLTSIVAELSAGIWHTEAMQVEQHGTARQYRRGCRCSPCRAAESRRKRDQRIRKLTGSGAPSGAPENVVTLRPGGGKAPPEQPGEVESAVIAETGTTGQDRPALVANAITLARILDNDEQVYMWPQTSRQLTALLNELHGGGRRKRNSGRLASVQSLVKVGK
jgi:hypothetical protein